MRHGVTAMVLASLALASCSGGGAGKFVGKWESTYGQVIFDLKSDHTASISVIGIPSEGTWEAQGKNRIVVHGPRQDLTLTRDENGDLTDGMLGRWVKKR